MKKKYAFLLISALIAAGGVWRAKYSAKDETVYDTTTVTRGDLRVDVAASGTIRPVNVVSVGTQVSGIIEKVYVDYNSGVKKGDLIAKLETFTLEQDLNEARAAVTDAKARLDYAELNARRDRELFEQNFISSAERERSDLEVVNARAACDKAVAQEKKAKRNLGYARIVSPVNGTIVTKKVEEGQTVASSFQTPELFTIAEDLTKMQIEAQISEADIGQIKAGLPVSFTVDTFPADVFNGVVTQVRLQPAETSNVVMYTVIVSISNDDLRLLPGMTAYITVTVEEKRDVLKLQNTAFQFRPPKKDAVAGGRLTNEQRRKIIQERQSLKPNQAIVYTLKNNVPAAATVTKGVSNLIETEIVDGLKQGDVVVLEDLTTVVPKKRKGRP